LISGQLLGNNAVFLQTITDATTTATLKTFDRFRTSNEFYGGQVGFSNEIRHGRWFFGFDGKLGIGDLRTIIDIQGYSTLTTTVAGQQQQNTFDAFRNITSSSTVVLPNVTNTFKATGGVYALSDRIGRYTRDRFAVIPDGTLTLGYQITPTVSFRVGYNLIYVPHVIRATTLVNGQVNPNFLPTSSSFATNTTPPGDPRPALYANTSPYWIQGVNFGFTIRY
jgi:hypothetical protein